MNAQWFNFSCPWKQYFRYSCLAAASVPLLCHASEQFVIVLPRQASPKQRKDSGPKPSFLGNMLNRNLSNWFYWYSFGKVYSPSEPASKEKQGNIIEWEDPVTSTLRNNPYRPYVESEPQNGFGALFKEQNEQSRTKHRGLFLVRLHTFFLGHFAAAMMDMSVVWGSNGQQSAPRHKDVWYSQWHLDLKNLPACQTEESSD